MASPVRDAITPRVWREFNEPLEGMVLWPYLDVLGLVTAGMGNLVDPLPAALRLPWQIDGRPATPEEITADWRALKSQQQLRKMHYKYAASVTRIRLTLEAVEELCARKLASNAIELQRRLPDFGLWPADAQIAALSMAWAMGPGFVRKFPSWAAAARLHKWADCAVHGVINSRGNPGVVPRNQLNAAHFQAACTSEPDVLAGPCTLDRLRASSVHH